LIVGYIKRGSLEDPEGSTDWFIVRDNQSNTARNVIIPYQTLSNNNTTGWDNLLATLYININYGSFLPSLQSGNVNIVDDNGNKYVFNNGDAYVSSYKLSTGSYTLTNISAAHPMAVLNIGSESGITYELIDTSPILIKVSGGNFSSPYYNFTDANDNALSIYDGTFRFMRGRTYRFADYGVSGSHPFKVYANGVGSTTLSNGSNGNAHFDVTISKTHSTTLGDIYYICQAHSSMKGNMYLLNNDVNESGEAGNGNYDFFYGDVSLNVLGNFGNVSVYCYYHGYMGGQDIFMSDTSNIQQTPIYQINYTDSSLDSAVSYVETVLDSILTSSNKSTTYNITVSITSMDEGTLGWANWQTGEIGLNTNNVGNTNNKINDTNQELNAIVLIHEVLHVLNLVGIGTTTNLVNGASGTPPNVYTGTNGIAQYKNVLSTNGKSTTNISYVPIEDDGGNGTAHAHFEEGIDGDYSSEVRVINGTTYPVLKNEIMSGWMNNTNYLTPMTLGCLEDAGFGVNYNSSYVKSTGNSMIWVE
jgi:hypothetical protein